MEKRFDILPVKKFDIDSLKLQIELETLVKIDNIFWSKDSFTPNVEVKESNRQLEGNKLTITLKDDNLEAFVRYYLIAEIGGKIYRFYQKNHAEFPRAYRYHDLGKIADKALHRVIFLNDFGSIGYKLVPQIILDTYDRRLPINVRLTDLATNPTEISATLTIEWANRLWKLADKIEFFLVELNSNAEHKIHSVDYQDKFEENQVVIKANFTNLSELKVDRDYAFAVKLMTQNQTYTLLATSISYKLFEKFYPFYKGITLVPTDEIELNFTSNVAITLRRKIIFQEMTSFPRVLNDFEQEKYLTNAEKSQIKESYQTLENQWISQSAYHNFMRNE